MIDATEAEALACDIVNKLVETEYEARIQQDLTVHRNDGWVFFYDSLRYIESGNFSDRLAGNGPIFVSKSGQVTIIPTHTSWERYLDSLKGD